MAEKQGQKKTSGNKDSQNMRSQKVEKSPDKKNQATRSQKKTSSGGGK
ncbi:MAG TPA: hypothetical protein VF604_07345 [Pyrinomonadaceae bacterium]|jgi:hypothetical protein